MEGADESTELCRSLYALNFESLAKRLSLLLLSLTR